MPSTLHVAKTDTGTVTRSSATRIYRWVVLVKNTRTDRTEGAWSWSGDEINAGKAAREARKVYSQVRIVPVFRIQRTEPAFAAGNRDLFWHAVDNHGNALHFGFTKADLIERLGR